MRPNNERQHWHGFTLVELLVVVGIVTLLIALLMPALSKVRKHALEVNCAANLRSIGQALTAYTQHSGFYPGCSAGPIAVWPTRLRTFLGGNTAVFLCPAQDQRSEWKMGGPAPGGIAGPAHVVWQYEVGEPLVNDMGTFFSYGYNTLGTGSGGSLVMGGGMSDTHLGLGEHVTRDPTNPGRHRELRATRVKNPAEMIAVADSTVDGGADFRIFPTNSGYPLLPAPPVPGTIHRGGANILFCDGHVQWYLQKEVVLPSDSLASERVIRRMWNNDHEAH